MGILSPGADCISNLISLMLWIYGNVQIQKQYAKKKKNLYSQKVSNPNDRREEEKHLHFNWNQFTIKPNCRVKREPVTSVKNSTRRRTSNSAKDD